jgi:uncharacterized protein (DUF2249 family)
MRRAVLRSLRTGKAGRKWTLILDFSIQDLMQHLEANFCEGMNWENYGEWHIDHIVPMSAFRFKSDEDTGFKKCWALSNLQPLWAHENLSKGGIQRWSLSQ